MKGQKGNDKVLSVLSLLALLLSRVSCHFPLPPLSLPSRCRRKKRISRLTCSRISALFRVNQPTQLTYIGQAPGKMEYRATRCSSAENHLPPLQADLASYSSSSSLLKLALSFATVQRFLSSALSPIFPLGFLRFR